MMISYFRSSFHFTTTFTKWSNRIFLCSRCGWAIMHRPCNDHTLWSATLNIPVPRLDDDVVDLAGLVIERPDELDESLVGQVDGEVTALAEAAALDVVDAGGVVLDHPELDLPVHVGVGVEGGEAGEHARVDRCRLKTNYGVQTFMLKSPCCFCTSGMVTT